MFSSQILLMGLCLAALFVGIRLVFRLADAAQTDDDPPGGCA